MLSTSDRDEDCYLHARQFIVLLIHIRALWWVGQIILAQPTFWTGIALLKLHMSGLVPAFSSQARMCTRRTLTSLSPLLHAPCSSALALPLTPFNVYVKLYLTSYAFINPRVAVMGRVACVLWAHD